MSDTTARPSPARAPAADGTDEAARPIAVVEKRWLGITVEGWQKVLAPIVIGVIVLGLWEFVVRQAGIPRYILPGPLLIFQTLIVDWGTLSGSLWITLQISGLIGKYALLSN